MNDTTRSPEVAHFVKRMNRERVAAGLPPTIVDTATLRIIASIVSTPRNITSIVSAPRNIGVAA
jgi:hypothetical protein